MKKQNQIKRVSRAIFAALPLLFLTVPVQVQALSFTETTITSDSSILNPGTLIVANNFGFGASATSVNGVSFGTDTSDLTSSNWSAPGTAADFSTTFVTGTPLDDLLSSLQFVEGDPPTTGVLTIDGLTAGKNYLLQLLFANERNFSGDDIDVGLDVGGTSYSLGVIDRDINLLVAFNADNTTLVTSFSPIGSFAAGNTILNAYALHEIPEPATVFLLGAGLLGLARFRKTL